MEDKTKILRTLGLTNGEIIVYISLLHKGAKTASQLSKETNLNRSNLYRILERLIDKKLVFSSIIEKIRYFSVTRPERINELFNKKISSLKEKQKEVQNFVKEADKISEIETPHSEFAVEVHEGINEIKEVLGNVLNLKRGEIIYAIGKEGVLSEYPGIKYWIDTLFKKRIEKKIKFLAVYNLHNKARKAKSKNTEVRYANLSEIGDIEITFYKSTLLIYVMTKEKPRVIFIKSKEIVMAMLSYFKFLWSKAKEM